MGENKRIVVNTIILYVKIILTSVINFVISRLVLDALGANDYGLYSVVGGIVIMLNTLGTSMVATSYRYMAIEIGKGKNGNPNRVYNTILCIHLFLAVFLILIGETFGVFYVNNYLNVSPEKIPDALFVLHVSLLTTAFAVFTIPTNGLIIARERFLFTSIIELISVLMKLAFIVLLFYFENNRLKYYAVFLAICQLFIPICYQLYCRIKERDVVKWSFNRNITDYKEIFAFAWWIMLGAVACHGRIQGVSIIMNVFFGTITNAAFGLATQVNTSISYFTSSIQQATVPQIMKKYGGGMSESSVSLVYMLSRMSFLIMLIMAMPIFFSIDSLLWIWLDNPPEYTNIFVTLLIVNALISNLGAGMDASIQATGKIRVYQTCFTIINISIIPIIYVLYKIGLPVYSNMFVMIILTLITLVFQFVFMKKLTLFNLKRYVSITLRPIFITTIVSFLFVLPIRLLFVLDSIINTLTFCILTVIITMVVVYFVGLTTHERKIVVNFIKSR